MKYIGLDLGDGETAVALVNGEGAVLPRMLTLGNTKSILSLVGTNQKDEIVVGENVLLDFQMKTRSARFKSRFLRAESASMDILQFAKGVRALLNSELDGETAQSVRVALGCPAGWSATDRERYGALITLAGFPNVYTVSESRAAFLYANHTDELGLTARQLARPALVIDIGSSTTDFAHIVEGCEANVGVFGDNNLGGGLLDQYLLEEAVAASADKDRLQKAFADYPVWRSYCEVDARKVKEAYFTAQGDGDVQPTAVRKSRVYLDVDHPMVLSFRVDDELMNKVLERKLPELGGRSFLQALEDSLLRAKQVTTDHPPEVVILTGGASRMQFFRDACAKAFPDALMVCCLQPEYSIAYGLSVAARTDHALALFRQEVTAFFDKDDTLRSEIIRHLPALQEVLTPLLGGAVRRALADTTAHAKGLSKLQMKQQFETAAAEYLHAPALQEKISQAISRWAAESLEHVQAELNKLCDKYYVDRMDVSLARMHVNYPAKELKLPFVAYLVVNLGKVRLLNGLARKMSGLPERAMRKQIRRSLMEPNGSVAYQLCTTLEAGLKTMIDQQIASIELLVR